MKEATRAALHMEKRSRVKITGNSKLELYADPNRIEQVVVNFINNAVKYAPDSKEIMINVIKRETDVCISVTDQGLALKKKNSYTFLIVISVPTIPVNNTRD